MSLREEILKCSIKKQKNCSREYILNGKPISFVKNASSDGHHRLTMRISNNFANFKEKERWAIYIHENNLYIGYATNEQDGYKVKHYRESGSVQCDSELLTNFLFGETTDSVVYKNAIWVDEAEMFKVI